jgi:hypothetical protein
MGDNRMKPKNFGEYCDKMKDKKPKWKLVVFQSFWDERGRPRYFWRLTHPRRHDIVCDGRYLSWSAAYKAGMRDVAEILGGGIDVETAKKERKETK